MVVSVGQVRVSIVFRLLEVVQYVRVAPARISVTFPDVVIEAIAADVEHVVEDGGAAHHLTARPVALAVNVTQASVTLKNKETCYSKGYKFRWYSIVKRQS